MRLPRSSTVSDTTLIIADPPAAVAAAPADIPDRLVSLLSRAAQRPLETRGVNRLLFSLFGFGTAGDIPAAAVTRQADAGDAGSDTWLRADPVWMDVGSQLVMKAWGDLGLTAAEASDLAGPLAESFEAAGLAFSAPAPERWYLRLGGTDEPRTTPPDELAGRDCGDHLPAGPDAASWRRLMNETQMTLHNHPVNRERRAAGRPPANSLWFWGTGTLPGNAPLGFSRVKGPDALAHALAALPGGTRSDAGTLLIADGSEADAQVWATWRESGAGTQRVLVPSAGRAFVARPSHRLRFWRGRRSLESLLSPRPPAAP